MAIGSAVEMTWTSIAPEDRSTPFTTDPRRNSFQRDRWLAPITSWVAFSMRAKATSASATSLPLTS